MKRSHLLRVFKDTTVEAQKNKEHTEDTEETSESSRCITLLQHSLFLRK